MWKNIVHFFLHEGHSSGPVKNNSLKGTTTCVVGDVETVFFFLDPFLYLDPKQLCYNISDMMNMDVFISTTWI